MYKAEWDCTDKIEEMQREVDYYDHLVDCLTMSNDLVPRWTRLVESITAWVNLKEGLDPGGERDDTPSSHEAIIRIGRMRAYTLRVNLGSRTKTSVVEETSIEDLRKAHAALRPIDAGPIIIICHPDDRLDLAIQYRDHPVRVHISTQKTIPRGHPKIYLMERPPSRPFFIPEIPPMTPRDNPSSVAQVLGYDINRHLQGRTIPKCSIGRSCPCRQLEGDIARTGSCAAGIIIRRTVDL